MTEYYLYFLFLRKISEDIRKWRRFMEIPLYVFQEELQKSFRLTGQFSRPDYLCHTLRLYGPGTVLKAHVLYVVPEDQLERFQDAPGRREPDFLGK